MTAFVLAITLLFTAQGLLRSANAAANVIPNLSVETPSATPGIPEGFARVKSGNNQTTFTYPNNGYTGTHSLRIQMSNRVSGEAKWYFTDIPVTPGQLYEFTDYYRANVQTSLQVRFRYSNGSTTTTTLSSIPASTTWKQASVNLTVPQQAVSLTVMHTLARNGYLQTDEFSLVNTGDIQAPTITLTAPSASSTVSGTIPVTATASDNTAVTGVQFFVDSNPVGAEDTSSPYEVTWDTTTTTNASHTITAQARDAAGNIGQASAVVVTVSNTTPTPTPTATPTPTPTPTSTPTPTPTPTPPASGNLVPNPSLEVDGGNGNPESWNRGGFGTNAATFAYPVAGTHGAKAAKITVTDYTDGDAKWYFTKIPVQPNTEYTFSHSYKSNVDTQLVAEYTSGDGNLSYHELVSNLTSSSDQWTTASKIFTTPANVASMTVFHLLRSAGELTVDNFSLVQVQNSPSDLFAQGMVSLTFDDGWTSQYDIAMPILDSANLKGTFYITSDFVKNNTATNIVLNPSLEAGDALTGPTNWSQGNWGSNTASFTYPAAGHTGTKAAEVAMTAYTDGDAKWFPSDVLVAQNTAYRFTDYYKSTAPSKITMRYTMADNSVVYADMGSTLPASATWQKAEFIFTTPANVVSMTAFHLLSALGQLTVDDMSIAPNSDYMTPAQMLYLQAAGHELGAHTKTHPSLISLSEDQANTEIAGSKADLITLGGTSINNFAYPYGDYNAAVQQMVQNAGFTTGRSVDVGYNLKSAGKYALKVQNVEAGTTAATMKSWVDQAALDKTWLILVFHQTEVSSPPPFGTTSAALTELVNYLTVKPGIQVKTVGQVVPLLNP